MPKRIMSNTKTQTTKETMNKPMKSVSEDTIEELTKYLVRIVSETNGIALVDTMDLVCQSDEVIENKACHKLFSSFRALISSFQQNEVDINTLLNHPVAAAFFNLFKRFPLPFHEEHIHLTGSLAADFIYPRLKELLDGPHGSIYAQKIVAVYGESALPINSVEDVDNLIRLKDDEQFDRYLEILILPKLILNSRQAHKEAAFHMASELYNRYNVGSIRLKFTLSRASQSEIEKIPGLENMTEEDVVLGLYDGFMEFKKTHPFFQFILAPSFRKEADFYDAANYPTKESHFLAQVENLISIVEKYPFLHKHVNEVDTVGNERNLYRKSHFNEMKYGFRKLQYKGFKIRSHHGETWYTLKKGVQAVDNAMNIWHIDTLEHGLSLGINPNFYFHSLFQRVVKWNKAGQAVRPKSMEFNEINDMDWKHHAPIKEKLLQGIPLNAEERKKFVKVKFHTAREVEHYQHDVLNRMIHKKVTLTALPSSNKKLTNFFEDFKDHPFDWWEKKGVDLGVGTDNYITLNTNYIQEMLIILFTDPYNLKITKLLMVTSKENHRPYISQLLWTMRDDHKSNIK